MDLVIASRAERPDLAETQAEFENPWPEFMKWDPLGHLYYSRTRTAYAQYCLIAWDAADPTRIVAESNSVPFAMGADIGRPELPEAGWDGVLMWAWLDEVAGREPTHVSALEVAIRSDLQGTGLASVMLEAKRRNAARLGFTELVAPVRPNAKHLEPHTPMSEYAFRTREDGLPTDPWLRLHVRAGGVIEGVCSRAMAIPGTLAEWRSWTGLPFDTSGDVVVPAALNPGARQRRAEPCGLRRARGVGAPPAVTAGAAGGHRRCGSGTRPRPGPGATTDSRSPVSSFHLRTGDA